MKIQSCFHVPLFFRLSRVVLEDIKNPYFIKKEVQVIQQLLGGIVSILVQMHLSYLMFPR